MELQLNFKTLPPINFGKNHPNLNSNTLKAPPAEGEEQCACKCSVALSINSKTLSPNTG